MLPSPVIFLIHGGEWITLQWGAHNLLLLDAPLDETGLRRTNGDYVLIFGSYAEIARVTPLVEADLQDELPAGDRLVSALKVELFRDDQLIEELLPWQSMLLSFAIPEELLGSEFALLYWDEGLGTWIEIPMEVIDLTSDRIRWIPVQTYIRIWDPTLKDGEGDWVQIQASIWGLDDHMLGGFQDWVDPDMLAEVLPGMAQVSARAMGIVQKTGTYVLVVRE